ncbi:hypothetical protein QF001_006918 [Paraburkholderia youngii]
MLTGFRGEIGACAAMQVGLRAWPGAPGSPAVNNKKPRKTLILRGFSNYFGLRRNNLWCQERTRIKHITS